jgi:hypothetical protein
LPANFRKLENKENFKLLFTFSGNSRPFPWQTEGIRDRGSWKTTKATVDALT